MSNREPSVEASSSKVRAEDLKPLLVPLWNYGYEECGLVLKNKTIFSIQNVHAEPYSNFQFSIDDLERFCNEHNYSEVLGVYHTHPSNSPVPSHKDVEGWPKGGELRYFIVTEKDVYEWRKSDFGAELITG